MSVVFGVWLIVAGAVALLAGGSGARHTQRLRRFGQTAWATVVPMPAADRDEGWPPRRLIQYPLADGRVLERLAPPRRRTQPGTKVLVWYDPAAPDDVLVFGRSPFNSDVIFIGIGIALLLIGAAIAGIGY
jgi:Protein of unknown function (DUF3592)